MGSTAEGDLELSTQVPLLILIFFMILFAVCGNIALLFAMFAQPKLRTTSNLFIGSLAFSNLLTGLCTMPLGFIAIANKGQWILGSQMCELGGFIDQLTICSGMVTLGMTSVDRYFLVCHAVRYPDIMTRKRCFVCIAFIWLWSISVSIPPLLGWSQYEFSAVSCTCASGLMSSYFLFYVSATFPLPILIIFPTYYFILMGSMGKGHLGKSMAKRHRGNLRTAKIILFIIIIFAICVFPVFIIGILLNSDVMIPKSAPLGFSVIWLLICNSAINPILYGLLNKNFRAVYLRILQRCCGKTSLSFSSKSPGLHSTLGPGAASQVMNENVSQAPCSASENVLAGSFHVVEDS